MKKLTTVTNHVKYCERYGNLESGGVSKAKQVGPEDYLFVWRPDLSESTLKFCGEPPPLDRLSYWRDKYGYIDVPDGERNCKAVGKITAFSIDLDWILRVL